MVKYCVLLILLIFASCDFLGGGCSDEFKMVTLEIFDINDEPVILDRFETISLASGKVYDISEYYSSYPSSGIYPVLTDSQKQDVQKNGTKFQFLGYFDDQLVVSEKFLIMRGRCHIGSEDDQKIVIIE